MISKGVRLLCTLFSGGGGRVSSSHSAAQNEDFSRSSQCTPHSHHHEFRQTGRQGGKGGFTQNDRGSLLVTNRLTFHPPGLTTGFNWGIFLYFYNILYLFKLVIS